MTLLHTQLKIEARCERGRRRGAVRRRGPGAGAVGASRPGPGGRHRCAARGAVLRCDRSCEDASLPTRRRHYTASPSSTGGGTGAIASCAISSRTSSQPRQPRQALQSGQPGNREKTLPKRRAPPRPMRCIPACADVLAESVRPQRMSSAGQRRRREPCVGSQHMKFEQCHSVGIYKRPPQCIRRGETGARPR